MRDLIISIFGEYSPITFEIVDYLYDENGNLLSQTVTTQVANGASGVDWTYVLGVVAFLVVLYSILRIIGGVISRV